MNYNLKSKKKKKTLEYERKKYFGVTKFQAYTHPFGPTEHQLGREYRLDLSLETTVVLSPLYFKISTALKFIYGLMYRIEKILKK